MCEQIRKGFKVEVRFVNSPGSLVGSIVRVNAVAFVVSLAQVNENREVSASLMAGRDVHVMVTADDALYRFTAKLLRVSGRFLHLTLPPTAARVQRRAHVRQPCLLEVKFVAFHGRGAGRCIKGRAVNISCGGLKAVYEGRVEVGAPIQVSIQFTPDDPPLQVGGTVVRKEDLTRFWHPLARIAVRFDGLAKTDERRLAELIARLQVKPRRGTTWPK